MSDAGQLRRLLKGLPYVPRVIIIENAKSRPGATLPASQGERLWQSSRGETEPN
jgi:hypothetical protein